jgi:Tfp pilus assembly protein FimT
VEIIFCLSLLSLLFVMAFPAGHFFFNDKKLHLIEDQIASALLYAQNMATIRGIPLVLASISGSEDWSLGMMLFIDSPDHKYRPGVKILQRWEWAYPGLQVFWKGFQSNSYLLFANDLKHAATNGHFELISVQGDHIRLVINRLGHLNKVLKSRVNASNRAI